MIYTDMAVEFAVKENVVESEDIAGIRKTTTVINKELSKKLDRDEGVYISYDCGNILKIECGQEEGLTEDMHRSILDLLSFENTRPNSIMIVGIGNMGMIADSLGAATAAKINTLPGKSISLMTLAPGVKGVTGIESFDVICGTIKQIRPSAAIVVDTLAANNTARLGNFF